MLENELVTIVSETEVSHENSKRDTKYINFTIFHLFVFGFLFFCFCFREILLTLLLFRQPFNILPHMHFVDHQPKTYFV